VASDHVSIDEVRESAAGGGGSLRSEDAEVIAVVRLRLLAGAAAHLRSTLRPEIASQELDALFVDTGGATIFPLHALLLDGKPHPDDGFVCDYVGLAVDSNSGKGGPDRDGPRR
jgi:hypothetical protein